MTTNSSAVQQSLPRNGSKRREMIFCGSLIFAITLAVGMSWKGIREIQAKVDETRTAMLDRQTAEMARAAKAMALVVNSSAISSRASLDASLVDEVPRSRVLAELANAMRPGTTLLNVTVSPANEIANAWTLNATGLVGNNEEVAEIVTALKCSMLFSRIGLSGQTSPVDTGGKTRHRFQLQGDIATKSPAELSSSIERTVAIELAPIP